MQVQKTFSISSFSFLPSFLSFFILSFLFLYVPFSLFPTLLLFFLPSLDPLFLPLTSYCFLPSFVPIFIPQHVLNAPTPASCLLILIHIFILQTTTNIMPRNMIMVEWLFLTGPLSFWLAYGRQPVHYSDTRRIRLVHMLLPDIAYYA